MESLFEPGDRYFLVGDLLRRDEADFFYFVDRIGDTYRWKGENGSTAEVEEVVGRAPGVRGAAVVGVTVPGHEGRAGLCALVCEGDFDPEGFFAHVQELPRYAQPVFVRVMGELSTTGTFKIQKSALREQGADPTEANDPLYLSRDEAYVPLDAEAYQRLVTGEHRL